MKNNGGLDICYNVQSIVDSKNHFVIEVVATNDINDQNQLSHMALEAKELLDIEEMSVIADTGYYNALEIKKCCDNQFSVYIKKQKPTTTQKKMNFVKRSLFMTQSRTCISALIIKNSAFLKILLKTD